MDEPNPFSLASDNNSNVKKLANTTRQSNATKTKGPEAQEISADLKKAIISKLEMGKSK